MCSKTSPELEAQVVILREAGHTVPAIAAQLGLSLSTTKRICKRRGAVAGAATDALIDQARQQMLDTAFELETVQQQAAALVVEEAPMNQGLWQGCLPPLAAILEL
jgi:predicted transcriptional regulator